MTLGEYSRRLHKYVTTLPGAIAAEVERTKDVLLALNKDQLLYGRDAAGNVLTPSYMNDPYFGGNLKAAARYMNDKKEYEDIHYSQIRFAHKRLFPDKRPETPNLIITGTWFMDYLFINVSGNEYSIGSTGQAASDIESKYRSYGHSVYGLTPVSIKYYYFDYLRPDAIVKHFEKCMKE